VRSGGSGRLLHFPASPSSRSCFVTRELVDDRFFRDADYITLDYLQITRGVATSLLAFWAAWLDSRRRRKGEEDLRRSRERYSSMLEAFPAAVIPYGSRLRCGSLSERAAGR
jgi:PAS domain-containing protein